MSKKKIDLSELSIEDLFIEMDRAVRILKDLQEGKPPAIVEFLDTIGFYTAEYVSVLKAMSELYSAPKDGAGMQETLTHNTTIALHHFAVWAKLLMPELAAIEEVGGHGEEQIP